MATKLQIWNMALSKMGQSRQLLDVESMSTPEHRNLNVLYKPVLESMLEDHSWSFAKRVEQLEPLDFEFSHPSWFFFYKYPRHCLDIRLLKFGAESEGNAQLGQTQMFGPPLSVLRTIPFEILSSDYETKVVCTNLDGAWAEYITSDVDEIAFTPMFVNAFAYRLGAELALALAGDHVKHQELMRYYTALFERGKERVSNESNSVIGPKISKYESARR